VKLPIAPFSQTFRRAIAELHTTVEAIVGFALKYDMPLSTQRTLENWRDQKVDAFYVDAAYHLLAVLEAISVASVTRALSVAAMRKLLDDTEPERIFRKALRQRGLTEYHELVIAAARDVGFLPSIQPERNSA
jgi:hypothetical protein